MAPSMAVPAKSRSSHRHSRKSLHSAAPRHPDSILPVVRPARGAPSKSTLGSIDQLLSGQIVRGPKTAVAGKKAKKAVEKLPEEIEPLADVLVAGRKIDREIQFKVKF